MKSLRGKLFALSIFKTVKNKMYDDAKEQGKEPSKGMSAAGFEMSGEMMNMMNSFTILRLTSMMGMLNISFNKEELLKMNKKLNRIRAPKKDNK